jgi:stress response protein YsnF
MGSSTHSIEVNAPLSAVYNQWTQFEEFPHFMEGVQEVRQEGEKLQINIPLSREEPVVEKETRVTGAVRVRKTQGVEQETIREDIRREDVDVDESGKTTRAHLDAGREKV